MKTGGSKICQEMPPLHCLAHSLPIKNLDLKSGFVIDCSLTCQIMSVSFIYNDLFAMCS